MLFSLTPSFSQLQDQFTYIGSNIPSTERDMNICLAKARNVIVSLSVILKSDISDKIKRVFYPSGSCVHIYNHICTSWSMRAMWSINDWGRASWARRWLMRPICARNILWHREQGMVAAKSDMAVSFINVLFCLPAVFLSFYTIPHIPVDLAKGYTHLIIHDNQLREGAT